MRGHRGLVAQQFVRRSVGGDHAVVEDHRARAELQGVPPTEQDAIIAGCTPGTETFEATRTRTDRTWWLLAPNPFVVLADAAPALPPPSGNFGFVNGQVPGNDLDPLGQIGRQVRDLRDPQPQFFEGPPTATPPPESKPVWPTGLAVNVLLGVGAVVLTTRRLRTPSRTLPKGQRVA